MKQLAKFAIEIRETDFVLRLTDDDGEVTGVREFRPNSLDPPPPPPQVIDAFNDLMAEAEDE